MAEGSSDSYILLVLWAGVMLLPSIAAAFCAVFVIWKYNETNARALLSEIISRSNTLLLGALYFLLPTIALLAFYDKFSDAVATVIGTVTGYVLGNLHYRGRNAGGGGTEPKPRGE